MRYQELAPAELEIVGTIPAYAAGVLFRNGLGPREVETDKKTTFRANHWFDNLSQVHRFQIHAPDATHPSVRVTHNSRLTCDGLVAKIKKNGNRTGITFAARYEPCSSVFQKLQSFYTGTTKDKPSDIDISVTLTPNFPGLSKTGQKSEIGHDKLKIMTLCNKTDNSTMQMLDPETLEPIGIAEQQTLHPALKGPLSGAHAKTDPTTGDVYNYNLDLGLTGTYRAFTVSASTGKTSILAEIKYPAAYIHSAFLTENYYILCVWNSFFSAGGVAILWKKNLLDAISTYDASKPATWFVIDKKPAAEGGKGLVATYESDAFFCFHSINAYEEPSPTDPSTTDIVADLCAYDSLDILKRFYLTNLMSDSPAARPFCDPAYTSARGAIRRFRLPQIPSITNTSPLKAQTEFSTHKDLSPELPTTSNAVRTRRHRYFYAVTITGKSSFFDGLMKYDVQTGESLLWSEHGQTAGEPIFVADLERSAEEDAGVLLSVVLDGIQGKSYLLVLDAKTMREVGRANVTSVVGFGFHGTHVPQGGQGVRV